MLIQWRIYLSKVNLSWRICLLKFWPTNLALFTSAFTKDRRLVLSLRSLTFYRVSPRTRQTWCAFLRLFLNHPRLKSLDPSHLTSKKMVRPSALENLALIWIVFDAHDGFKPSTEWLESKKTTNKSSTFSCIYGILSTLMCLVRLSSRQLVSGNLIQCHPYLQPRWASSQQPQQKREAPLNLIGR